MAVVLDTPYRKCYCEENVYKFIEAQQNVHEFYAILVSNDVKRVIFHSHNSSNGKRRSVMWDYHVFSIRKTNELVEVYDKDSCLKYPESFDCYWEETMKPSDPLEDCEKRIFRVVHGPAYLEMFSSDRSHMNPITDPHPSWPLINPHLKSNLMQWIDMSREIFKTKVMSEEEVQKYFTSDKENGRKQYFNTILERIRRKIKKREQLDISDHWNRNSTLSREWVSKYRTNRKDTTQLPSFQDSSDCGCNCGANMTPTGVSSVNDYFDPPTSHGSSVVGSRAESTESDESDPVVVAVYRNSELIPKMVMDWSRVKVEIKKEPLDAVNVLGKCKKRRLNTKTRTKKKAKRISLRV